jgi:hypothetical protein
MNLKEKSPLVTGRVVVYMVLIAAAKSM